MDFETFNRRVSQVQESHPVWFGMLPDEVPDEGVWNEAETRLRVKLPRDYRDFVFMYGGGYFAFSNVYSLEIGSDWNLVDLNQKHERIRDGHVLISENGVGDFYGFKIMDGICEPRIYFYDHELGKWEGTRFPSIFDYLSDVALKN